MEVSVISGPDVHYSGEKLLSQLFSIENNFRNLRSLVRAFNSGILKVS